MPAPLSEEHVKIRREAIDIAKSKGFKRPYTTAAAALTQAGYPIRRGTLSEWDKNQPVEQVKAEFPMILIPEDSAREKRDSSFFKRLAAEQKNRIDDLEHLTEELAGIRGIPVSPPIWTDRVLSDDEGHSILIAHTSDVHIGEVIVPDEVRGFNEYNPTVARDRMNRYFQAVCEIGSGWMLGRNSDGVLLTLGGDLISGDIHEELRATNALTATEQIQTAVEIYEAGARLLADKFGSVHIAAVPGNHGRTTPKPQAKLVSRLSYDIMAAAMLRERLRADDRFSFSIATGTDVIVPIYGRNILLTHGDKMGTGGGQGFAGPVLPIIRGAAKVQQQNQSAGIPCDLILIGHYHTSAAPPGLLANGSVIGYSEYGNTLRGRVDQPKQWLARYSSTWGLCDHVAVQLAPPLRSGFRFKSA